jgi:hypothetical protein
MVDAQRSDEHLYGIGCEQKQSGTNGKFFLYVIDRKSGESSHNDHGPNLAGSQQQNRDDESTPRPKWPDHLRAYYEGTRKSCG